MKKLFVMKKKYVKNFSFTPETYMKIKLREFEAKVIEGERKWTKVEKWLEEGESVECDICFENVKYVLRLDCKHELCENCLEKIKENDCVKCPFCRRLYNVFMSHNLTEEEKALILEEFTKKSKSYRT